MIMISEPNDEFRIVYNSTGNILYVEILEGILPSNDSKIISNTVRIVDIEEAIYLVTDQKASFTHCYLRSNKPYDFAGRADKIINWLNYEVYKSNYWI